MSATLIFAFLKLHDGFDDMVKRIVIMVINGFRAIMHRKGTT